MGNLIKPAEYAKKLGISRQAVYAKIKKGILTAKSVEGKLYIVQNEADTASSQPREADKHTSQSVNPRAQAASAAKGFQDLLAAKDETIGVLKETIVDLKETNQMITSTLRGEVDLLKEAFSEMKMLYSTRIEHLQPEETSEAIELEDIDANVLADSEPEYAQELEGLLPEEGDELAWIELEDFFDEHDVRKQAKQAKLTKRLKKLFKKGDSRIDSFNGEFILLAEADYSDVIKKRKKA